MKLSLVLTAPGLRAAAATLLILGLSPQLAKAVHLDIPGKAPAGPRVTAPVHPLPTPAPWGARGHGIVSRVAMDRLPSGMPEFFREATAQLVYLGPEPDRWRSRDLREMDDAWEYDHYVDLENVPEGALDARDRYEFIAALYEAGIHRPQQFVGFLPWRTLEVYQRLMTEFAIWRNMSEGDDRGYVEARILNDAGVLGHYAADGSQPHHTTIHFNGWAENAPNPRGFTTERDFHSRFESGFVGAHLSYEDVAPRVPQEMVALEDPRAAIWEHIRVSNGLVGRMYELEKAHGFQPDSPPHADEVEFVAERLASGAEMLRLLWWTAWEKSEELAAQRRAQGWGQ